MQEAGWQGGLRQQSCICAVHLCRAALPCAGIVEAVRRAATRGDMATWRRDRDELAPRQKMSAGPTSLPTDGNRQDEFERSR